jgi:hypothetical protein
MITLELQQPKQACYLQDARQTAHHTPVLSQPNAAESTLLYSGYYLFFCSSLNPKLRLSAKMRKRGDEIWKRGLSCCPSNRH